MPTEKFRSAGSSLLAAGPSTAIKPAAANPHRGTAEPDVAATTGTTSASPSAVPIWAVALSSPEATPRWGAGATATSTAAPSSTEPRASVDRCRTWGRHRGLLAPAYGDALADERALRALRRLRDTVQSGFTAVARGRPFPEPEWRELRRAVAQAVAHADLAAAGGRVVLRWPGAELDAVGDAVAQAAYHLLTSDQLRRVKVCAGCHWLFLDQSKNGSRRWCSMEDCGTSAKMRRYVARRAARRAE